MRVNFVILIFAVFSFSGCDFKLRNFDLDALQGTIVYVDSNTNYTVVVEAVKQGLQAFNIKTTNDIEKAQYTINLDKEIFDRRRLTIDPNTGQAEEYEISYTAELYIRKRGGELLLKAKPIHEIRNYEFDESIVLNTDEEERILHEEIAQQVANNILRQIQVLIP